MLTHPRSPAIRHTRRVALATAIVILLGACSDTDGTDAATAASAGADADSSSRQTFVAELTEGKPAASSGFLEEIHYRNPADPEGKPYAVERIVVQLPEGSRIDTSVPERCTATDPELLLLGAAACPPDSNVGSGLVTLDFGPGLEPLLRYIEGNVSLFNNSGELIFLIDIITTAPLPLRFATRAIVEESRFVTTSPPLPSIPPPDPDAFVAIRDVLLVIDPVASGAALPAAYITTPASCPASGRWTITATFSYRDGVTETVESSAPCA